MSYTLEEKGQYVTNAFIIICDYLVFAIQFLHSSTNVTSTKSPTTSLQLIYN
jgi:hypothetical protein